MRLVRRRRWTSFELLTDRGPTSFRSLVVVRLNGGGAAGVRSGRASVPPPPIEWPAALPAPLARVLPLQLDAILRLCGVYDPARRCTLDAARTLYGYQGSIP